MGYVLLIVGLLMIVTGVRDTYQQFGQTLVKDFTGPGNFTYWIASLGAVGLMGYIEPLRTFSRAFMFLIIIGMILKNGGIFDKLQQALQQGPVAVNPAVGSAAATTGGEAASSVHISELVTDGLKLAAAFA